MTLDEFLARLRETKGWFLKDGKIRQRNRDGYCRYPIIAISSNPRPWLNFFFLDAADGIGLDRLLALDIVEAADNPERCELRDRLLEACGL